MFESMLMASDDPVLSLSKIYNLDKHKNKINLGIGVYTDSTNNVPILKSVKQAESLLLKTEISKNYLNIEGIEEFNDVTQKLLFGSDNSIISTDRIRTVQAPGGTGALRIISECIAKNSNYQRTIWISQPTWINHKNIFLASGLSIKFYPYYNETERTLDFDQIIDTLKKVKSGDIVLFHGCCHNPTGTDPNLEQWNILSKYSEKTGWIPIFDLAYQGFASNLQEDLQGIHIFCKNNPELIVCNSYSKNFGLYNERVGACTIVAQNNEHANRALSQLKTIIRAMYSNPPVHGASIVSTILKDKTLRLIWENELNCMRNHIQDMRRLLFFNLQNNTTSTQNFAFIQNQRGMFAYLNLNNDQVIQLRNKFGIYLVGSGRINLAGLSNNNINYVSQAIHSLYY